MTTVSNSAELHRLMHAYEVAELAYRRQMLLLAMREDETYWTQLDQLRTVRDQAHDAWLQEGRRLHQRPAAGG